ncbi:SET domain-containing protein [Coniophora puteana RWD-64-598 SS2]|uniref:SET domain-containing protein n=1 Tax=Coniophora puteana (strain RWD-64-598) TaxID=741705 RepID=A0A5M3MDP0_CONPW|nr:SET domain-containing protein [Coniophora puteana RWD-64-598 SS2]EIW76691.1 SET domain-containing protein [Coniophora puteana RWD-64-598 SS2]
MIDIVTTIEQPYVSQSGESGCSAIAQANLPPDVSVATIPASLVVTPSLARGAIYSLTSSHSLESWSERQLICTYICLHWLYPDENRPACLRYKPYLDCLPSFGKLTTPMQFSEDELRAFAGTNIHGAVLDRRKQLKLEWETCQPLMQQLSLSARINDGNQSYSQWENWYYSSATYLSSRAFPSSLLDRTPSLESSPTNYPILLPVLDSLNHRRAQPVSWVIGRSSEPEVSTETTISIVSHDAFNEGQEIYNNYGPKPNSELILGYGFSLPNNPDDTIVLQLGGSAKKHEVGRNARGAETLWEEMLEAVRTEETPAFQTELDAADFLQEMLQMKLSKGLFQDSEPQLALQISNSSIERGTIGSMALRLTEFRVSSLDVRPATRQMLEHYMEGQIDILISLMGFAQRKEELALATAKSLGAEFLDGEEEWED